MRAHTVFGILVSGAIVAGAAADPGVLVIRGARVVPVSGPEFPVGTIVVRGGRIEAVGRDLAVPPGAEVVEAAGLVAYPGLIDACSSLGLNEISNVAATVDDAEIGRFNPQVRVADALHMDSVHVPIARAGGITAAHVVPSGAFIAGQSALVRLAGRVPADRIVRSPAFMRVRFQDTPQFLGGRMVPGGKLDELSRELKELLGRARLYGKARAAAAKDTARPAAGFDETMEFMLPVVEGRLPVMFDVGTKEEIEAALKLIKEEKLRAVLFGAGEAEKATASLKEAGVPVILSNMYGFPPSWEDGYDARYRLPAMLEAAGVTFALASDKYLPPYCIDLPYQASKAAAFGLDRTAALRSVTLRPAQILGVGDLMGSLEAGKAADIVLADGDILDRRTRIVKVFIDGRPVDLSNRYTELLRKAEEAR